MNEEEASRPTVNRLWLALEIKRLRLEAGLNQTDIAEALDLSQPQVARIENAKRSVREPDLPVLLTLFGIPPEQWVTYLDAARHAEQQGWWQHGYDSQTVPPWFARYVGLEQGATQLSTYSVAVFHGLLQCNEYITALMQHEVIPRTDDQVKRLVEVRRTRREVLTRDANPLKLDVIVYEAVLRGKVGSWSTMRKQLAFVSALAERSNVTIQVLPYEAGPHAGAESFIVFGFDSPPLPSVAYVEHRQGAEYMDAPHEVDHHKLAFQHLRVNALPPNESIQLIQQIAEEYPRD